MSKGNTLNDLLQLKSFPRYTRWLWQCWYGTHPLCSQVVMVPTCCCRGGQTEFEASVFCCIIKSRYFGQLRMLYEISKGLVATFCLQSFMVWSVCQVPVERGYLFWTRHWQRRLHCNGDTVNCGYFHYVCCLKTSIYGLLVVSSGGGAWYHKYYQRVWSYCTSRTTCQMYFVSWFHMTTQSRERIWLTAVSRGFLNRLKLL